MSSQRQSFLFALEGLTAAGKDNFGAGRGYYADSTAEGGYSQYKWIAPPPGSYLTSTPSRMITTVRSAGTKFWDVASYGHFSGTWEWTFVLDYQYLEPLVLAFDTYTPPSGTNGIHQFTKLNYSRVPSFVIRRKVLNRMVGGSNDEVEELYGCICRSVSFSKNSSNSQTNVTMSGVYVNERMLTGKLTETDYQEYSGRLVEWMCMFIGTAANDNYVANTDSLSLSLGNNLQMNDNICSPFSTGYGEGNSEFSFSTSCFSYIPERYKQRVYTGGRAPEALPTGGYGPLSKNLSPMPLVTLMSYNASAKENGTTIEAAITASTRKVQYTIEQAVLKSLPWQKGDGSKLQDQLSSVECRKVAITVTDTDAADTKRNNNLMTNPPNAVASSVDPTS